MNEPPGQTSKLQFINVDMSASFKSLLGRFCAVLLVTVLTSVSHSAPAVTPEERLKMRQEMIEFVVKSLPTMLYGYTNYMETYLYAGQTKDYAMAYHWIQNSETLRSFPIRYVSDSEFKVHNIDVNRLGINTGTEILIHADRLGQMPEFTVPQAIQLMLHEFNHLIKQVNQFPHRSDTTKVKVPLKEKDEFANRFSDYIKTNIWSTEYETSNSREQYSILELQEPKNHEDIFDHAVKRKYYSTSVGYSHSMGRYLSWKNSETEFTEDLAFDRVFRPDEHNIFTKTVNASHAQYSEKVYMSYPFSEIQEITSDRSGEVSIRFAFTERVFGRDTGRLLPIAQPKKYLRTFTGVGIGYHPYPEMRTTPTRHFSFRMVEPTLSFHIEQSTPKDGEAFVTLKMVRSDATTKTDPMEWLKGRVLAVIAKDDEGNRFSFRPFPMKTKNGEVKIQFRMPHILNLTLTEILVQKNLGHPNYEEHSIRPQNLQKFAFSEDVLKTSKPYTPVRKRQLDRWDVDYELRDPVVVARMPVNYDQVQGVTVEIRVPMEITHSTLRFEGYPRYYQTIGYKIFVDRKKLEKYRTGIVRDSEVRIPIPLKEWGRQEIAGEPEGRDSRGHWSYGTETRLMEDMGIRGVTNIWVHLKSGENLKLDYEREPTKELFSRIQREWDRKAKKVRREEFEARTCPAIHLNK